MKSQNDFSFFKAQLSNLRELLFKTRNNISIGNEIGELLKEIVDKKIDSFNEFKRVFNLEIDKTSKGENKVAEILDEMLNKIKAEYEVKINELIDNSGEEKVREGLLMGLEGMIDMRYSDAGLEFILPKVKEVKDLEKLKKIRNVMIRERDMKELERQIEEISRY